MNSIVGPIFNEKVVEKWNLWVREQCIRVLFMDPQISLFINFFIKNGSHDTIYTFKNYFVTVFFSFQFSAVSKRTLNRASYCSWRIFFLLAYSILLCHFFCSLLCVIVCVCGFFFLRCWLFQLCFCSVFIMNWCINFIEIKEQKH